MYVVLQGIGSLPCIIKGIDQFPLGSSDLGCLKFLNWNIKKTPGHPNDKFLFVLLKKMSFSTSPKVTPTTGVVEL